MTLLKKSLLFIASIIAFMTLLTLILLATLFVRPDLILTPSNLEYALNKSDVFKSWSWNKALLSHEWIHWNERVFSGEFKDFCFEFENEASAARGCFEVINWQVNLSWSWGQGFKALAQTPILVRSSELYYEGKPTASVDQAAESTAPDLWSLWETLWSEAIPDLDIKLDHLKVKSSPEAQSQLLSLQLTKQSKQLSIAANIMNTDLNIEANPEFMRVTGPKHYPLKVDLNLERQLALSDPEILIKMNESAIEVQASAELNGLELSFETFIDLPLTHAFSDVEFLKRLALKSRARASMSNLQKTLKKDIGPPFDMLPAPLNVLNGAITLELWAVDGSSASEVLVMGRLDVDLEGQKQVLKLQVLPELAFDLAQMTPGSVTLGLELKRVALLLPRLSKTRPPPQFLPDSRIKVQPQQEKKQRPLDLNLHLQASGKRALAIETNLLDEPLRLNLDLTIEQGSLSKGMIEVLPLSTTIFKRPIHVKSAQIRFQAPLEPTLKAEIEFRLPEYLVTLVLEGPLSQPRPYFSSVPSLPLDDIYAVLLFGRPMTDLAGDDRTAAQQTNRVLSQGILSLSVLYFFAGTPVESLGYDPDTNELSAQIGLGSKNSLRVGSQDGGLGSVGIRRSLGKGWYLDTGVQKITTPTRSESGQDYGVLLERIISY